MANSEDIIKLYIQREKRKGTPDPKIIVGITKLDGQAGKDAQKMISALREAGLSPSESLGDYFGLNYKSDVNPKTPVNKNAKISDKLKSYGSSALMGLADAGGGILQGVAYAGDKVNEGINSAAGTNLKTDAYDKMNKERRLVNKEMDNKRANAGRSGGDWVRTGTEIGATVPAFFVGGGSGQGFKQTMGFMGRQGAIGTTVGASRAADNSKERLINMGLGGAGGAVGGVVGEKVVAPAVGHVARKVARSAANKSGSTATAATKLVDDAIAETEMAVSDTTRKQLVAQATKNLQKGKEVDAAAMARQELLRRYELQGTRAQISRDPIEWKNEAELAKNNQPLNDIRTQNHEQVRSTWQSLADDTNARPVDNNARMESTFQTLKQGDEAAQADISAKYNAAREMSGNDAQLNHMRFIDQTSRELEENGLGSFLKGDIRGIFKGMFDDPNFVLTHGKSEEIIKILNARLKATNDGNERYALGIVRRNLDNEVDASIAEMSGAVKGVNPSESTALSVQGQFADDGLTGAKNAWGEARGAARSRFEGIDSNPALKAALDDVAPDKAFDKYVLRADERDLVRLVDDLKGTPEGQQNLADLQGAAIEHFIKQASRGNDGAFSPAGLNRALDSFGDNRMKALFTPQQIARINDVKQISDILLQQPLGSAVNHSNTASAIIPFLQSIVGRVPVGGNLLSGAVGTAAKKVGDVNSAGAAARAMNGQAGVTKGSSLGLTEEQLRMLGMIPNRAGRAGAALGAGASN